MKKRNIVISTGAGISAESGVHTYRDLDGLWTKYDPSEVMSVEGWVKDPEKLIAFQNELRAHFAAGNYQPNAAHLALAKLQKEWKHGSVTIITQNVDGLHEAVSSNVLAVHGNGKLKFCENCKQTTSYDKDILLSDECTACGAVGTTRPDIVMFGEIPRHLNEIDMLLSDCSIFAVIGSSLEVAPANQFVFKARNYGADTYLINKEQPPSGIGIVFEDVILGNAGEEVPKWVDKLLAE